jgi:cyclophilin family peptidyl-prolyl cis-trans isomerase
MLNEGLAAPNGSPAQLAAPAALQALARSAPTDFSDVLQPFLLSNDEVLQRAAARAYQPGALDAAPWKSLLASYSRLGGSFSGETKTAILERLEPWLQQPDVRSALRLALDDRARGARITAARLLKMSGANDLPEHYGASESAATRIFYELLAGARQDRTVAILETDPGDVEVELFREDAPLTVANFVRLGQSGFYNGLSFMRVAPNFVVQGGDPRNDQEGGPGYSIRCEINMRPFERGSIGMALEGKDTGGSQFFITLAAQPHLDGAYTCFGRVISGMQVVDRLLPGDRIRTVRIKEDVTALDHRRF